MNLAYCNNCEDLVNYTDKDEVVEEIFHDTKIKYPFKVGRCKICGEEVATDLNYNYQKSDAKWKTYHELVH